MILVREIKRSGKLEVWGGDRKATITRSSTAGLYNITVTSTVYKSAYSFQNFFGLRYSDAREVAYRWVDGKADYLDLLRFSKVAQGRALGAVGEWVDDWDENVTTEEV